MQGVCGSVVRNTGFSSGGQDFRSQQPRQAAPSGLRLQELQRPLLHLQHTLTQMRQTSRFLKSNHKGKYVLGTGCKGSGSHPGQTPKESCVGTSCASKQL